MSVDSNVIRSLVREALREAVAARPELLKPHAAQSAAVTEVVSLVTDADVSRFVSRILDMAEDSTTRAQLRSGAIAFTLGSGTATAASPVASGSNAIVIEKGAVTESMVRKAAEAGATLHLGPRAVLTSLAKDKARAMGVDIVKTSHNGKGAR